MNLTDCREIDSSNVVAAKPIAQLQDIAEGRRELARLIGRLLAHEWLHKQRAEKRGHDRDDDDIPRSE